MSFSTFEQVVEYLESFTNLERKTSMYNIRTYRLDRMTELLKQLGNPQDCFRTIHIAGSKGKGSTASFIAKAIQAAGFKCGLYMSPHVTDYRERFSLAGEFFDDEILIQTGNTLEKAMQSFRFSEGSGISEPTTFELYTAFAFLLFKAAGCSWAVIETGLGGRLDATNVLDSTASVLTPIELEHTDILGDSIEKIAVEKSKIIKQSKPSFSAIQKPEAIKVFRQEAMEKGSVLTELSQCIEKLETTTHRTFQYVKIALNDGYTKELKLKMLGDVQAYNCALAIVVLKALDLYREGITEKALEDNIIPGRMELVDFDRPLYIDGAHTEQSMKHLLSSFRQMYKEGGICIFGAVSGKNHEAMGELILDTFDTVIISKPGTFKKNDPSALYKLLNSINRKGRKLFLEEDSFRALELAKQLSKEGEPILACGSFYLAGAVKEAIEKRNTKCL